MATETSVFEALGFYNSYMDEAEKEIRSSARISPKDFLELWRRMTPQERLQFLEPLQRGFKKDMQRTVTTLKKIQHSVEKGRTPQHIIDDVSAALKNFECGPDPPSSS